MQEFKETLVGGKTFAGLAEAPLSVEEVKKYPFICLEMGTATYRFYHEWMLTYGIELVSDIEAATTDQILPLVKSELGLAFLPETMASEAIQKGEIVSFPLRDQVPERYVCMRFQTHYEYSCAEIEKDIAGGIIDKIKPYIRYAGISGGDDGEAQS